MKSALLEELVGAVEHTASLSKDWFIQNSSGIYRAVFFERNGLGDNGTGAVYAYFDTDGTCLYVGQTGRRVKARLHDKTSPHKDKGWWEQWSEMRFVQESEESSRLLLEMLLIQAYKPSHNSKPKPIDLPLWLQS
ncbi:hypothetical protein [Vibrio parahaemolyticus]|uniref:hypothetical protein n=1 Tax=Vibrio parahaemolyticus TaxID=670 RepID=UPI0023626730|nr:hypothetical protein [Vibrio parahaemolyticus]HCG6791005.1 hypothetical protein [Vibrio parahaemolyticus]HCH3852780.1 hypothetical protein [Vibrio parahaemolyticus]HCM1418200.1 hypothetical protein [Vibrio parahaemolyticus]